MWILGLLLFYYFLSTGSTRTEDNSNFVIEIQALYSEKKLLFQFQPSSYCNTELLLNYCNDFCLAHNLHASSSDCHFMLYSNAVNLLLNHPNASFYLTLQKHESYLQAILQPEKIGYIWDNLNYRNLHEQKYIHINAVNNYEATKSLLGLREQILRENIPKNTTNENVLLYDSINQNGSNSIDLHRCLHIFSNIKIDSSIKNTTPNPTSTTGTFGRYTPSDLLSIHGNCTGNLEDEDFPYQGTWKEFVYKHAPYYQPYITARKNESDKERSCSHDNNSNIKIKNIIVDNTTNSDDNCPNNINNTDTINTTYQRGVYVAIYDLIFCHNIAHVLEASSTFWSFAAAATADKKGWQSSRFRGVHFLTLDTDRCNRYPVLSFATYMHHAILQQAIRMNISVLVGDLKFAQTYLQQCVPPALASHSDQLSTGINLDNSTSYTNSRITSSTTSDNNNTYKEGFVNEIPSLQKDYDRHLLQRQPYHIYSHIIDRPYHWHVTSGGLKLMNEMMYDLCALNSINTNDYYQEQHRQHSYWNESGGVFYLHKHSKTVVNYTIIIASRAGARYIANKRELFNMLQDFTDALKTDSIVAATETDAASQLLDFGLQFLIEFVDMGQLSVCDQISIMRPAQLFICVHGSECALAQFMRPHSIVVELYPGCCLEEPLRESQSQHFQPIYRAACLTHVFFYTTYVSSPKCTTYYPAMLLAPSCGTYIDTTALLEVFEKELTTSIMKQFHFYTDKYEQHYTIKKLIHCKLIQSIPVQFHNFYDTSYEEVAPAQTSTAIPSMGGEEVGKEDAQQSRIQSHIELKLFHIWENISLELQVIQLCCKYSLAEADCDGIIDSFRKSYSKLWIASNNGGGHYSKSKQSSHMIHCEDALMDYSEIELSVLSFLKARYLEEGRDGATRGIAKLPIELQVILYCRDLLLEYTLCVNLLARKTLLHSISSLPVTHPASVLPPALPPPPTSTRTTIEDSLPVVPNSTTSSSTDYAVENRLNTQKDSFSSKEIIQSNNNTTNNNITGNNYKSSDNESIVTIWSFWDSGEEGMPLLTHEIYLHNKLLCERYRYAYHLITMDNLVEYFKITLFHPMLIHLSPDNLSDYIRIHILHLYGGIWLDSDYLLYDRIDLLETLLVESNRSVLFMEEYSGKVGGSIIVAKPYSVVIQSMIQFVDWQLDRYKTRKGSGYNYMIRDFIGPLAVRYVLSLHSNLSDYLLIQSHATFNSINFVSWQMSPAYNVSIWFKHDVKSACQQAKGIASKRWGLVALWTLSSFNALTSIIFYNDRSVFYHLLN